MSYTLHKKINSGGMADLWFATKDGLEGFKRALAVKVIRSDFMDRDDFAQMFTAEAKMLSNMNHANIMPVIDLTTIDKSPALVMELNIGGDLSQIFRHSFDAGALIPIPMLMHIVSCIAQGLDYAHNFKDPLSGQALGVVHRDISPGNILLATDGKVRLSDFGIAKAANRGFETAVGQIKGKYAYMSPEQLRNKALDRRSDVFSLGVVLWEGLAGRFRFGSLPEFSIHEQLISDPVFQDLTKINENVSVALNEVVMKCLRPDPNERYRRAVDLARDLDRQLALEFSSFTPEKLGRYVERSLKNQVDEFLIFLRQALVEKGTPAQANQVGASVNSANVSAQFQSVPASNAPSIPSPPQPPAPSISSPPEPPVPSIPSPPQPAVRVENHVGHQISVVTSDVYPDDDSKKINLVINLPKTTSDNAQFVVHKGRDLTMQAEIPGSISQKLRVSGPNLRSVPPQRPVNYTPTSTVRQTSKIQESKWSVFFLLLFFLAVVILAILNFPAIGEFLRSIKVD
jgi:serine/threonine-protein kinase